MKLRARWGRGLGLALLCAVVGLCLLTSGASALMPAVTTTADSSTPGSGSLRAAIAASNPGDTIFVPANASHYQVTLGEIQITHAITIRGAGAASTIIDAKGLSRAFHIMSGVPSAATVTFQNLTITGGHTTALPGGGAILDDSGALALSGVSMTANSVNLTGSGGTGTLGGGAIYTNGAGVSVTGSSLSGNSATLSDALGSNDGGAAIYQNGSAVPISISGSTIDTNHTTITAENSSGGGAIYQKSNAPVAVTGSQLDGNTLTAQVSNCCTGGAAIYQGGTNKGITSISSSTLDNNTANVTDTGNCCDGGGAIYQDSYVALSLDASVLNGNATTVSSANNNACCAGGGAISSFTQVLASNSTLDFNTATTTDHQCCDGGGAINIDSARGNSSFTNVEMSHNSTTANATNNTYGNGGGALNFDDTANSLTIASSDFSANRVTTDSNTRSGGGGLYSRATPTVITNSTFSDNSTSAAGATVGGGGVYLDRLAIDRLSFDTIVGNGVTGPAGAGGGVFLNDGTLSTKTSIIAQNTAAAASNCAKSGAGAFSSLGYNLENSPDGCGFTAASDKVLSTSLGIGPLANNGGPTLTRALLAGSPAINAIPLGFCTDQTSPTPLAVSADQRGVPRPQPAGGLCDIGAYEFGAADVALTGGGSPTSLLVGQRSTLSLTVADGGPAPATNSKVAVSLPAGLKFVSGSAGLRARHSGGGVLTGHGADGHSGARLDRGHAHRDGQAVRADRAERDRAGCHPGR